MRALLMALTTFLWAHTATAQLATLVADSVTVEGDTTLVATGDVEILYEGTRLQASRITYRRDTQTLLIDGPIVLTDGPRRIVLAAQAELDDILQRGILTSARLVLDQQLQLAATQIAVVGDRYTQLDNTVASSCQVCASNPTPTWEIRARKVVHDRLERQIYFTGAQFRLLGVPIAYFPRLRLPDPSRSRSTGLLIPRLRTTSNLGTGIKLPYFIVLGDHADLRLTPYLSSATTTLQAEYRQNLRRGTLTLEGALSGDDLEDGLRYYLFGAARLRLPYDFRLAVDIETVSDEAYLLDYDYSERDRLESEIRLSRARRDELIVGSLTQFRTLRDAELPVRDQLPSLYGTLDYERRLYALGGEVRLGLDAYGLYRESGLDGPGRDVGRVSASGVFTRAAELPMGVLARADLGLSGSLHYTGDDGRFAGSIDRVTPSTQITLRWPLQRRGAPGVHHLLEPVAQLAWARSSGDVVPNEDSVLVEFDQGNLLALSRFPGSDRIEQGTRAALGLTYTRAAPSGSVLSLGAGRIFRADGTDAVLDGPDDDAGFAPGTGLDDARSDWLATARLGFGDRLAVTTRSLFDDDLDFTKSETRLAYADARAAIAAAYLWVEDAPLENRIVPVSELTIDGSYRLTRHWTGTFDTRYDLEIDRAARAGLGVEYRTECLRVGFSVSRRFTSSVSVDPTTDFGLELNLAGVGGNPADQAYRRTCS